MSSSAPSLRGRPATQSMDPRIKARRIEVRRGAGRRRLQRLADVGAIVLVAVAFAGALRSPLLDVDRIEVSGAGRTGVDAVLADLGIERGQPLIDVDLRAAGARVAALPWVDEVSLHRRLDGVVEVGISERVPVALVARADGEEVVVDATGRVLAPRDEAGDVPPLVRIVGASGPLEPGTHLARGLEEVLAMAGSLATVAPGAVTELRATDDGIRAALASGGQVRFGGADRSGAKVRSLVTVLEQVDLSCLDELDLRLPGSPVLTREDGCS